MAYKPLLRPGRPDDENTDYLPLSIKGSDIVVNESGNNSQPYPELWEFHEDLLSSGIVNEWLSRDHKRIKTPDRIAFTPLTNSCCRRRYPLIFARIVRAYAQIESCTP